MKEMKSFRIKSLLLFAMVFALFSCKKDEAEGSDIRFTEKCEFAKFHTASKKVGILMHSEFGLIIDTPGELPLWICNMPTFFHLPEGETRTVEFSGRYANMNIDFLDAGAAPLELSYLKFLD